MKLSIFLYTIGFVINVCLSQDCPKGFFASSSSCYVILDEVCPWIVAVNYCSAFGMNLAVIEDSTENQFLKNYLLNNSAKYNRASDIWTAGSNILASTWAWSGTGREIQQFFWGPGEPNQSNGGEHCLSLYKSKGFTWNDEGCGTNGYPLCQKSFG